MFQPQTGNIVNNNVNIVDNILKWGNTYIDKDKTV